MRAIVDNRIVVHVCQTVAAVVRAYEPRVEIRKFSIALAFHTRAKLGVARGHIRPATVLPAHIVSFARVGKRYSRSCLNKKKFVCNQMGSTCPLGWATVRTRYVNYRSSIPYQSQWVLYHVVNQVHSWRYNVWHFASYIYWLKFFDFNSEESSHGQIELYFFEFTCISKEIMHNFQKVLLRYLWNTCTWSEIKIKLK